MRIVPPLVLASFLLLSPALASAQTAAAVSLDALRAHLEFLAGDELEGRDTGARGHEIAARYAAAQFRQWGLAPGHGDSYLQAVPLRVTTRRDSALVRRAPGAPLELAWKQEYTVGARPGATSVAVEAPLVFVGFGIDAPDAGHTDYAGVDVAGKIVVALGGAPASFASEVRAHYASSRQKRVEAARRGAIGLLTVKTRDDERRSPWERSVLNAGRPSMTWRQPDGSPVDDAPGMLFTGGLSHAGLSRLLAGTRNTLDALLEIGDTGASGSRDLGVRLRVTIDSLEHDLESPNVVAVLAGADPLLRDEIVVCTAHLDHVGIGAEVDGDAIYNGFYDNAMGSAIVMEMARVLAAGPAPRRSIAFVLVTGEERGLLGSDYFARHPSMPGTIVANVNVDMPLFLHPVADLVAFGAEHSTLGDVARRAIEANGFRMSPDPEPEESIFVRSDQYSFVRQGVPAIYLDTGFASRDGGDGGRTATASFRDLHYHRPSDEAELGADWDGVARFTAANAALARAVAGADERPRWLPESFFGRLFGGLAPQGSGATPSSP